MLWMACLDLDVAVDISLEGREVADAVLLAKFVGNGLGCLFEYSVAPQNIFRTQKKMLGAGRVTQRLQQVNIHRAKIGPAPTGHEGTTHPAHSSHPTHPPHGHPLASCTLAEITDTDGVYENIGFPRRPKSVFA